ncbi:MAG: hypothetical protein ACW985_00585 [Candidatus Thorarchaeota archaeon]|jgi:hypothetical protein
MSQKWNRTLPSGLKLGPFLVLSILFLSGTLFIVASQTYTSQYEETTVEIGEAVIGTPVYVYAEYLRVDQILSVATSVSNGSALFSIRWLDHTILWGAASSNPELVFQVNGFSNYSVWLDSLAGNTNISVTIGVTTLEYPLVHLFPIGSILLLLGIFSLLILIPADIIRLRGRNDDSVEVEEPGSRWSSENIFRNLLPVIFLIIAFVFLTMTDPGYVHNDSVGGGLSGPSGIFNDNWGYEAWGYLDFAQMVVNNLQAGDFSYLSWSAIHGSSKSIGLPMIAGWLSFLTSAGVFLVYRVVVRVFFVILAGGVGLVSQALTKSKTAFYVGSILTLTNPIFLEYSRSLYQEIPLCAMLALALYFIIRMSEGSKNNAVPVAIFVGLAAAFKSILILAPFFFGLFIVLLLNTRSQYWNRRYFAGGFIFLFLLALSALLMHLLSYPLRWTDPIGKLLGISQSAGFVSSEPLTILHNLGFLAFFLIFQIPLTVLALLLLAPGLSGRYDVSIVRDLPLTLFAATIPFYIIESRLIQHHMAYSLWPIIIAATITFSYILESKPRPSMSISSRKAIKYGLVIIVSLNIILVMPNAPYTGLHQNPFGSLLPSPEYFEPTYGLQEASALISEYPALGYIVTVRAPHVLSYYLPERAIIIPPGNLETQPTSLARLAMMLSLPVDMVLLSEGFFEIYPVRPEWVQLVYNSRAFELAQSFSARGLPTADVFVNRLLHRSLEGDDIIGGNTSISGFSPAGDLTLSGGSISGSFNYLANQTVPGVVSVSLFLPQLYSVEEGIFILHMNLSGDFSDLPDIILTLRNNTSHESMLLSPDVAIFSELSLACNFSAVGFSLKSYDRIEITIYDPEVDADTTFEFEIDRVELNTPEEGA